MVLYIQGKAVLLLQSVHQASEGIPVIYPNQICGLRGRSQRNISKRRAALQDTCITIMHAEPMDRHEMQTFEVQ